jgi:hypothetical protein
MLIRDNNGEVIDALGDTQTPKIATNSLPLTASAPEASIREGDCASQGSKVRLEISKARGVSLQTTAKWKEHRAN